MYQLAGTWFQFLFEAHTKHSKVEDESISVPRGKEKTLQVKTEKQQLQRDCCCLSWDPGVTRLSRVPHLHEL